MPFYVGEFRKSPRTSRIKHIRSSSETEKLQDLDVAEIWDHIFEWDDDCVKASTLESWREQGDELCDAALLEMFPSGSSASVGEDLLQALQSTAESHPAGPSASFLRDVKSLPPGFTASDFLDFERAIEFFVHNSVGIMQALMHFSLAGGFASPRITRVLEHVSYLVPPASRRLGTNDEQEKAQTPHISEATRARTYSRLLETMQFVLDVMNCTVPSPSSTSECQKSQEHHLLPGGDGWKSIIRVRLLHGIARRRILESGARKGYDRERDGIPINQEDLAATLASFSIAPLWCLERLPHLSLPSTSEKNSFIRTWRHIGFYLGISPQILDANFSRHETATKFLASAVVHLLEFPSTIEGQLVMANAPTLPILHAVSNRPPFPKTFEHHCALTRHLLGDALSTHLLVPSIGLLGYVRLHFSMWKERYPQIFGEIYPRRGWQRKRHRLVGVAMARVVRWQLGMRRTNFRPRTADTGELVDADDEKFEPDPEGAKKLVREWRRLLMEMVGVTLCSGIITCGMSYVAWERLLRGV